MRLPLAVLACVVVGCAAPPKPAESPWVLASHNASDEAPTTLENGSIGLRLDRFGVGSVAYLEGVVHSGAEEKLAPMPSPLGASLELPVRGQTRDYSVRLDMRTGHLTAAWRVGRWRVEAVTVLHPTRPVAARRWRVSGVGRIAVRASDPPERWTDTGATSQTVTGEQVLSASTMVEGMANVRWLPGAGLEGDTREEVVIDRVAGYDGEPPSFDTVSAAATQHWKEVWATDVELDGPAEDQRAIRNWIYHLRAASGGPPAPFGLTHARYHGHVFWDADVWILPALAFIHPDGARRIAEYRLDRAPAARENYRRWVAERAPIGRGVWMEPTPDAHAAALMFPWESGPSGYETTPAFSRFGHHVTGSVVWGLDFAATLALVPRTKVDEVGRGAAAFYRQRSVAAPDGARELRSTLGPDEFRFVDNDLYTNVLAEWVSRTWGEGARFRRPRDETSLLTHDDDAIRAYKQASALLAVFPLQDPEAEGQAAAMLARFGDKTTPSGPAMSESIHATIQARIGDPRAYESWRASWQRYATLPVGGFAENARRRDGYFLTGAAGCLNAVLFGFAGLRVDTEPMPGAAAHIPLADGRTLSLSPRLPAEWRSLTLRNIFVLGRRYTIRITAHGVTVNGGERS